MLEETENMRITVVNKTFLLTFLSLYWVQCYCDISSFSPRFEKTGNEPVPDLKNDPNYAAINEEQKIAIEDLVVQDNERLLNVEVSDISKAEGHEKSGSKDSHGNFKVKSVGQSEDTINDEVPRSHSRSVEESVPYESGSNSLLKQQNVELEEKKSTTFSKPLEEPKGDVLGDSVLSSRNELPKSQNNDGVFLSAAAETGHHTHSEAMPSFDEWKKMMLAEQSKDGLKIPSPGPPGKKITTQKRKRNYASYECGAKIVGSNTEAEGTSRILNELFDEYMLNPCKAKIWFVIELCEAVQALQIELANFELFSSCPKEFAVYSSDHYPTRDWTPLGIFQALEQRVLQSFQLKQEGFGKFIKIELLSYYGKEHYCPLSVVRLFGTSMVDEYEEMETAGNIPNSQHEDADDRDVHLDFGVENEASTNLFGSATDAVLNIVKKAAQVLGRDQSTEGKSESGKLSDPQNVSEIKACSYYPDSSDSCSTVNGTDEGNLPDSPLSPNIELSYSSLHQSLFHYLHQCDSCISSSQEQHQSSALPTCRFFKAALGPVLFQRVCDFLKDHPLTSLTPDLQVSGDHNKGRVSSEAVEKPQQLLSPPPTIISVIIDGPMESKLLPTRSDGIHTVDLPNPSETMPGSGTEIFPHSIPIVEENLGDPKQKGHGINPTKTIEGRDKIVILESSSDLIAEVTRLEPLSTPVYGVPDTGLHRSNIDAQITVPSVDSSSVSLVDGSSVLSDSSTLEAFASSVEMSSSSSEKLLESDADTLNDTIETDLKYEDVTVLPIETTIQAPDEFSEDLKIVDERISDIPKDEREVVFKLDPTISGGSAPTAGQKESVFMRMNNRIKALELNMSLSSQYLQELSQRYRRQMEEMQRAFNRTIGTLNDTARKAAERDVKQQEVIASLQAQVANLTLTVELLMAERTALYTKMIETHVFLMIVEAIVMITILSLCVRRISSLPCGQLAQERDSVVLSPRSLMKRRNSAEMSVGPICTKLMKRSASEEILTSEPDLLIVEPSFPVLVEPPPKVKKKYQKKKNKNLSRSASNPSLGQKKSNPVSRSQNKEDKDSSSAGVLFSRSKPHSLPEEGGKDAHICENCNIDTSSGCIVSAADCNRAQEREKRTHSSPLQNLTNGVVCNLVDAADSRKDTDSRDNQRFSLKKFLKVQKRDSV